MVVEKKFHAQRKAPLQLNAHQAHRQRIDDSGHDRLAAALEALTAAIMQTSSGQHSRPKLMSYEETVEVTGLKRSTLEAMVRSGRFREGRHFIKEGSRVLFHPDLLDRMFEDKLHEQDAKNPDSEAPEGSKALPAKKPQSRPTRNGNRLDLNYPKGENRAAL